MKENRLPYCKNTGFRVPEDYFGNLEDRIMAKVTGTESPDSLLEKQENPFKVPDNYFKSVEEKILQKVEVQKKPSKLISLLHKERFYYAAGVAAVFAAIFSSSLFQQPEIPAFEELNMLSIENYLDESLDYSSPEVSKIVSEELYSFAPSNREIRELNQEAVMEYLQENLEDPSVILNKD